MKNKYFKVRIEKASNKDLWYVDKIGDVIMVKRTEHDGAYFEAKNGFSVVKQDVSLLKHTTKEKRVSCC